MSAPPPVDQLDAAVAQAIRSVHRARWAVLFAVIGALVIAVALLGLQDWQQRGQLREQAAVLRQDSARITASCEFWKVLAPLPVTILQPARKPSEAGVALIAGSRTAYAGQGCGNLAPAAPSLVQWAAYFRIPLPGNKTGG